MPTSPRSSDWTSLAIGPMLWTKWPRDAGTSGAVTPEKELPMPHALYEALA
jgi:hypothetical protein